MTTILKMTVGANPVAITSIRRKGVGFGDEIAGTEKVPGKTERELIVSEQQSYRIDELPYEAPATDR